MNEIDPMTADSLPPLSLNLHLTETCNMACRGCFARYGDCGRELTEREWLDVLEVIARETDGRYRIKVTFAGGEPTRLPYLPGLAKRANALGFVTGIITNGSILTDRYIDTFGDTLGWIGISIDSLSMTINKELGRVAKGVAPSRDTYLAAALSVKSHGIKLKINTVLNTFNVDENFNSFIESANPDRWKVMQMLVVKGQNDGAAEFMIDDGAFKGFIRRHCSMRNLIVEDSGSMLGSYVMLDPRGRPYGNATGSAVYGSPVFDLGFLCQLPGLGYRREATESRNGFYF